MHHGLIKQFEKRGISKNCAQILEHDPGLGKVLKINLILINQHLGESLDQRVQNLGFSIHLAQFWVFHPIVPRKLRIILINLTPTSPLIPQKRPFPLCPPLQRSRLLEVSDWRGDWHRLGAKGLGKRRDLEEHLADVVTDRGERGRGDAGGKGREVGLYLVFD